MHPDWARLLRDQCVAAGVPFFFKQWGEYVDNDNMPATVEVHEDCRFRVFDDQKAVWLVGKRIAGRKLDGVDWSQFPQLVTGHSSLVTAP